MCASFLVPMHRDKFQCQTSMRLERCQKPGSSCGSSQQAEVGDSTAQAQCQSKYLYETAFGDTQNNFLRCSSSCCGRNSSFYGRQCQLCRHPSRAFGSVARVTLLRRLTCPITAFRPVAPVTLCSVPVLLDRSSVVGLRIWALGLLMGVVRFFLVYVCPLLDEDIVPVVLSISVGALVLGYFVSGVSRLPGC